MSGPKNGKTFSLRREIEAAKLRGFKKINFIKSKIESKKSYLEKLLKENISEIEQFVDSTKIKTLWDEVNRKIINKENELNKIEMSISQISVNGLPGLFAIGQSNELNKLNKLVRSIEAKELFNALEQFELTLSEEVKRSSIIKEKIREEKINQLKNIFYQEKEFLLQWIKEKDEIEKIENEITVIENKDYNEVVNNEKLILNKITQLKEKAINNEADFKKKAGISESIFDSLKELGFTNIERRLSQGKLGDIVVLAETPSQDWNVSFNIKDNNEIIVETPEDNRCYVKLPDLIDKLKHKGVSLEIPKLKEKEVNGTGGPGKTTGTGTTTGTGIQNREKKE